MNAVSRLPASLRLAALIGALCGACTDIESPARIMVLLDADLTVRERVSQIEIELQGGSGSSDGGDTRVASRPLPKPALDAWPLRVALPVPRGASSRLLVVVTAKDAAAMAIAQAQSVSEAGAPIQLVLHFDAECAARSEPCAPQRSCRHGACLDAAALPVEMPLSDAGSNTSDTGTTTPDASTPGCVGAACAADGCGADRAGCDPLATCTRDNGTPRCGQCPAGFAGSGDSGCIATLSDLQLSGGTLRPAFSPEQTDYLVEVPLLSSSTILRPSQAPGVTVLIEGRVVESGADWSAPEIAVGASAKLSLVASAPAHNGRTYTLTLRRMLRSPSVLHAQNPAPDDQLGSELALSGDTLVAGARFEDGGPNSRAGQYDDALKDSGAAYVFVRKGAGWTQQAYLKADVPLQGANFGYSVAIDGDRIAVGARNDRGGGAVYVFERTAGSWQQSARLGIDNAADDLAFGAYVALQGERLAIGAVGEDTGATDSGAVFLFEHSANGWTRAARLKANKPGPLDWLGSSVALDGDMLVTGATGQFVDGNPSGAAHVFVRSAGTWSDQGALPAKGLEAGALFGTSVAIAGDTIAVGAFNGTAGLTSGAAFVFVRDSSTSFRQEGVVRANNPESGDYFGLRLAMSADHLLVGASRLSAQDAAGNSLERAGAAYLFEREAGVWRQVLQLTAAQPAAQQQFGDSVALDGQTLAVGALADGSTGGTISVFE
jgi:hypothetical protein